MMEIKRILWPTDFSKAASVAESYVISLSRKFDAEVHLLHVAEDLTRFESYWGSGPDLKHFYELHEYELKVSKERLQDLCENKLSGCPRYQIHIVVGDPAREILKAVETLEADVVVMATHGMKANFQFGSVAEKVVKNSPVPVFMINPSTREEK